MHLHHHRRLWHFHGGLHLPDNKALSTTRPLAQAALPSRLLLPLQQHIGEAAEPRIKVGDRVLKGQRIAVAGGAVSAPIHAPTSGKVSAIDDFPVPHPSGLPAPCILIESDGEDRWGELPAPLDDYRNLEPDSLRQRIREAGIVGMGGAAFPTSIKLTPEQPIETLIVNGAECEPYISCDDLLMRKRAERVLTGADVLMHLLGAHECLIGIEDNKPEAIAAMRAALAGKGLEGAEVVTIPTLYPSGGEKQLIRVLTGKEVPSHGLPAQLGIVCHNVGTIAAVADAVLEGKPLISRIVTITGQGVKAPGNMEVLIGTPAAELIDQCGGYDPAVSRLILGGPMMGFTLTTDEIPITKAANCLLATTLAEAPPPDPARPCIRCGECARVCPVQLLPQQLYWYARAKDLDKVQDYNLFDCIECGCCAQVCPSHIPLVQYYRHAKADSWAQEQAKRRADRARQRHEARVARLERLEQERKARLRKKKQALDKGDAKGKPTPDARKQAIEAAMQRVAEKKAAQQVEPRNTEDLTEVQRRQISEADSRREALARTHSEPTEPANPQD